MKTIDWLNKVAYKKELDMSNGSKDPDFISDCYLSKFDDSYITHVGLEEKVEFLAEREITEQLTHGVGFSLKDNKWYGWSHRDGAIYGFEIGSTCKKGDCHYRPTDKDDFLDDMIRFWDDEDSLNIRGEHTKREIMESVPINPGDPEQKDTTTGTFEEGVYIEWEYSDRIPNKKLRNTISGIFNRYPKSYGKGEWTAKTMEDAKQMAIDFNEGVS